LLCAKLSSFEADVSAEEFINATWFLWRWNSVVYWQSYR
jgi:hypothetical protein